VTKEYWTGSYTAYQFFNVLWGITQLTPFLFGMRMLLVTRPAHKFGLTKDLKTYTKAWWGVVGTYLSIITLCCFINMCMNPGGEAKWDWYDYNGTRVFFAKTF